jgi:hypothetical protein
MLTFLFFILAGIVLLNLIVLVMLIVILSLKICLHYMVKLLIQETKTMLTMLVKLIYCIKENVKYSKNKKFSKIFKILRPLSISMQKEHE